MSNDISYKVLIIDDAFFIRKLIKKAIESKPMNDYGSFQIVEEAINGESGIQKYFETNPDLVTLDINMPGINGVDVVKKILEKDSSAKILVISGNDKPEIKDEILKAGALDYIQKPFQNAYLWERLDKIFNLNPDIDNINVKEDFIDIEKNHVHLLKQIDNKPKSISKNINAELQNNSIQHKSSFDIVSPLANINTKTEDSSIIISTIDEDDDDILSSSNKFEISDTTSNINEVSFEIESQLESKNSTISNIATDLIGTDLSTESNIGNVLVVEDKKNRNNDVLSNAQNIKLEIYSNEEYEDTSLVLNNDDNVEAITDSNKKFETLEVEDNKNNLITFKKQNVDSFEDDISINENNKDKYEFKSIMSFDINRELLTSNNNDISLDKISGDFKLSEYLNEENTEDTNDIINEIEIPIVSSIIEKQNSSNIAQTHNIELNDDISHYNIETSKNSTLKNTNESKKVIHIEPPRNKVLQEIYLSHGRQGVVNDTSGELFKEEIESGADIKQNVSSPNIISKIKSLFNKKVKNK